ncbi:MAG: serine hydrolase [Saprospiraceae bacterium]|nr:serine hydrolase [Saprospiraceae bacterium]MDW8230216.1 serine hydrolase [Saprospiraceae bacterium]
MVRVVFLSLVLTLCGIRAHLLAQKSLSAADPRLTGMDSVVQRVLNNWHAPGCAIAVVEKGRILFAGGFGYRDYPARLPVTDQTLFQIGSCTKAFTCALAGLLANDGLLDLDGKVQAYLPEFRLQNNELTGHVTLRDFMCHRSGLPRHDLSWLHSPTTRDSFIRRMAYLELSADLRERWQYNNFGYTAVGAVLERVSGKSWEALTRERLFEPLGMRTARFDLWTLPAKADFARGHRLHTDTIRRMDYLHIEGMGPAGSICANAADIARWLLMWTQGGQIEGRTLLPYSFVREALSAQMAMDGSLPGAENPSIFTFGYGLGWVLSNYYGHYRAAHGGGIHGFTAEVCLFPADSIGIAVFVNQNRSQAPAVLRNLIADRLLQLPYRDWDAELRRQYASERLSLLTAQQGLAAERKTGTSPTQPLPAYAGRYYHGGYGAFEVVWRNDSLLALTPGLAYHLTHFHYDVFRAVPLSEEAREDLAGFGMRFQFIANLRGEMSELHAYGIEPGVEKVAFKRKTLTVEIPLAQLERYCGKYAIGGTEATVFLKGKTLTVSLPGQPEYETVPVGEHTFKLKALEGYSVRFEMKEDGITPNAMLFIQPNGTFRATRQ